MENAPSPGLRRTAAGRVGPPLTGGWPDTNLRPPFVSVPVMRRILALLSVLLAATPAVAQDLHRLVAQVPLLPLAEGRQDEIEGLIKAHWRDYWGGQGRLAFGREDLRVGRIDLDGDGRAELFVMIDRPAWETNWGKPFVVATWGARGWSPVGWGWGDEDSVFVTAERLDGWLSIDTPSHWLRHAGKGYQTTDKPR